MSNPTCYLHQGIIATTSCDKCHNPICASDHRRYGNAYRGRRIFCPPCYSKQKRNDRIGWALLPIAAIVIFIILSINQYLH